jgi:hypothetical protein
MKVGDVWGNSHGKLCGAQKILRFDFSGNTKGVHFVTRSCSGKWGAIERFRVCQSEADWNKLQTKARRTMLFNEKV